MRILIVDFNEDFYPIYNRKLKELEDIKLFYAKDIGSAISLIQKEQPDCILLNHLFYNNREYYNRIREVGYRGDIIIVVAGKESIVKRTLYNGISGVIDKSLNGTDFRKSLCNIMNLDSKI